MKDEVFQSPVAQNDHIIGISSIWLLQGFWNVSEIWITPCPSFQKPLEDLERKILGHLNTVYT